MKNSSSDKWFAELIENPLLIPSTIVDLKERRRTYLALTVGSALLGFCSWFVDRQTGLVLSSIIAIMSFMGHIQVDGWIKLLLLHQAKTEDRDI